MSAGEWVTTAEAAEIIGIRRSGAYKWLARNLIESRQTQNPSGHGGQVMLWRHSKIAKVMETKAERKRRAIEPYTMDRAAHMDAWREHLAAMPEDRRERLLEFAQHGARGLLSPATAERLMDYRFNPDEDHDDDA